MSEGATTGLTERTVPHNRGRFPAINVGAMHAKGTINPINLSIKGKEATVARLLKNPHVWKLAAFASCKFILKASINRPERRSLFHFRFSVFICTETLQGHEGQTEQAV